MRVKVTMEMDIDLSDIDSRGDEEWEVFHTVRHHLNNCGNADDFYGTDGVQVDYEINR